MRKKNVTLWISLLLLTVLFTVSFSPSPKRKLTKTIKSKFIRPLKYALLYQARVRFFGDKYVVNAFSDVRKFSSVQNGSKTDLVKRVKRVQLVEPMSPYNASLIEDGDGFLLCMRYDKKNERTSCPLFNSYFGVLKLDQNFEPITKFCQIDTKSDFAEDPRMLRINRHLYITYNDLPEVSPGKRFIKFARLNLQSACLENIISLDYGTGQIEKNWMPFGFTLQKGRLNGYFTYRLNPHSYIDFDGGETYSLAINFPKCDSSVPFYAWEEKWGTPRGGTPPRLVDGEYLAFMHSHFVDKKTGLVIYVMGAYTFEAAKPFRITSVSRQPILFEEIYSSPIQNTADKTKRVIYPSGFVVDEDEIHVACGENDCAVKIVTFDKQRLFKSLQRVDFPKPK